MEKELKSEVTSKISLPATVGSTSDVPHLSEIKKESSLCESHSYGGLILDHDVESTDTGTNVKLKIDSEVKPEVTSEISLTAIVDSTLHVRDLNEIKNELSLSQPHSYRGFA